MTTHYDTLGLERTATAAEIKKAYRKLAKEFHPDANQGDAQAEERFKKISEAYYILSDPDRRSSYDSKLDEPHQTETVGQSEQEYQQQQQREFYRSMYVENSDVPFFKWKMAAFIAFVLVLVGIMTMIFKPWDVPGGLPPEVLIMQIDNTRIEMRPGHPYYPLMLRLFQSSITNEDEALVLPAMRMEMLMDSLDHNLQRPIRDDE